MNVLSLFDGMSCGQVALNRLGIKYGKYYASEIDKYAIQITQKNYPDTIQLGDVTQVFAKDLPKIDLLIGGSPCQGFSFAGKGLNFKDSRSKLFFEFVRLLKECKPKYFLLENVKMKREHEYVITDMLGVSCTRINSNLVSAQNRKRLYWTNIPGDGDYVIGNFIDQPEDKKIGWGSIRETDVAPNFYYRPKALAWLKKHSADTGKVFRIWKNDEKCQMIEANHFKGWSSQRFFGIEDVAGLRYITPLECERAQTVPDNYTEGVSNTQRYKMIGNGWTVDVIAHILKNIPGEE